MATWNEVRYREGQSPDNPPAAGYMLVSVALYSVVPIFIVHFGDVGNPFLFNSAWLLGMIIGSVLYLSIFHNSMLFDLEVLRFAIKRCRSWYILIAIFGSFYYAFYVWSIEYIDVSITTILTETWPVFFILTMSLLDKRSYQQNILFLLPLMALTFAGFIFITASQTGGFSFASASFANLVNGSVLALLAALADTSDSAHFRWGRDFADTVPVSTSKGIDPISLVLFGVVAGSVISSLFGILFNVAIGVSLGETVTLNMVIAGVVGGLAIDTAATILFRKSNLITDNLGVNALGYLIPAISLAWLAIDSEIGVGRYDYLIIGSAVIVTANLLINFQVEIRTGFKVLLSSLAIVGLAVYIREEFFELFSVGDWHWTATGYFEAIALSATIFTLLLAFRVARLVTRTAGEEVRIFNIFRKLDLLAKRDVISSSVVECVLRIDAAAESQSDLKEAYALARGHIDEAWYRVKDETDRQMLNQAETDLDALVRSKQTGVVLGELFALVIFAGITIALSLLTRPPDTEGWTRFLVDVFAVLICAVMVFLLANVWDLHRERGERKLEATGKSGNYEVRFPGSEQSRLDLLVSVFVGIALVGTFALVLAGKWVWGWFV